MVCSVNKMPTQPFSSSAFVSAPLVFGSGLCCLGRGGGLLRLSGVEIDATLACGSSGKDISCQMESVFSSPRLLEGILRLQPYEAPVTAQQSTSKPVPTISVPLGKGKDRPLLSLF